MIEAMEFVQILLTGQPLPREAVNYISKEKETCKITVKFIVFADNKMAMVEYSVQLQQDSKEELEIVREKLSAAVWDGKKFKNKKTLIDYSLYSQGPIFTPKYRFEALIDNNNENKVNLGVAKKIAQKDLVSFIFSTEGMSIFLSASNSVSEDYAYIIDSLHHYAAMNLFVISNAHAGAISMNFLIPFAFRLDLGETIAKGDLPIRLDKPSAVNKEHFNMAQKIINEMNIVLGTLVPGLSIGVYDFGEQLLENGSTGHKIELTSRREGITIPLKYESEGILKIISVLNALMCVYNNPNMCLIIDELDAGIYEYLLGEILSVLKKAQRDNLSLHHIICVH